MVSGVRTTEPAGGSTPRGRVPQGGADHPRNAGKTTTRPSRKRRSRARPRGPGDETSPDDEAMPSRLSHKDAWRLFQKLPDRTKSGVSRPKTWGKWIDHDGVEQDLVSAEGDESAIVREFLKERNIGPEYGERISPSHGETKFDMFMRLDGLKHESIVINNIPCEGEWSCEELLKGLPPGATLTVLGPAGFKRTYPLHSSERTEQS
jgi:hypothetical protein